MTQPKRDIPVNMREGVIWAYRHLLQREPSSEADIAHHLGNTAESLREAFTRSAEYRSRSGQGPVLSALEPVLDHFRPFASEPVQPGMWRNFLGSQTRTAFLPPECASWSSKVFGPPGSGISGVHDEAEWLGTLLALRQAQGTLVVVELGAGWAPWLVSCAVAARQLSLRDVVLIGVEGSADHVEFMRQHMRDNGVDPRAHRVIHGVVGVADGVAAFPRLHDPAVTYGAQAAYGTASAADDMEEVQCLSLETVLNGVRRVDLLHCDIQGMEAELFRAAGSVAREKVRRIVVGTHGRAIEAELHTLLAHDGWVLEADLASQFCQVGSEMLLSIDGTQVWRNPGLAGY